MPNAAVHRIGAALVVGGISAYYEYQRGESSDKPLAHAAFAAACGTLPDILEPAAGNPNHRQFFHSFTFAGLVGHGMYKLLNWETSDDFEKLLKTVGIIAGGAYLIHLIMDSSTPKSLPLI